MEWCSWQSSLLITAVQNCMFLILSLDHTLSWEFKRSVNHLGFWANEMEKKKLKNCQLSTETLCVGRWVQNITFKIKSVLLSLYFYISQEHNIVNKKKKHKHNTIYRSTPFTSTTKIFQNIIKSFTCCKFTLGIREGTKTSWDLRREHWRRPVCLQSTDIQFAAWIMLCYTHSTGRLTLSLDFISLAKTLTKIEKNIKRKLL